MENDSLSSLHSRESETSLDEDSFNISFRQYCTTSVEEEEEYVEILMERETEFGFKKDLSFVFGNFVKCHRLEAIAWILKARAIFGFQFQTAYLSMTYFDRFLMRRPIKMWLIRLLPVACLALAAKMEEAEIPSLSDFRFEDDDFGINLIGKMELFVLSTLEWKMNSITPFAFLHYFITRLCQLQSPPTNILSRTTALIMATIRETNIMEHRPSVIAAAATLVALEQKLSRTSLESKMNSISHCKSLQVEDVFSCYNIIRELKIYKESSHLSMINDVMETSSVTTAFSSDRKRLGPRCCGQYYYGQKRLR
ncbi:cyclin-D5-1 [Morus notabilis]|uniref:cyclin-D5-1 n=1 Tax=Morus notabilis TaxID=981085 RepID=UPI000CED2BED|nr:cyclin-D5-1 [Morus notabilis]